MQAQISILRIAGKPTVDRFFIRVFKLRYPTLLRVVWSVTYLERHGIVKRAPPSVAPPSIKRATSKDFETWKDALIHCLKTNGIWSTMNTRSIWWIPRQFGSWVSAGVLVSYIDDGLHFEADDLKDAFVRLVLFLLQLGFFFWPRVLF